MIISLGNSCKVREAIQRFLNCDTLESNMFDWVFTNFSSILYFIENIDKPLIATDFYDTELKCFNHRGVNHCNLRFDTLHDINANESYEEQLPLFLEKYNRRLQRLKLHILSNEKIHFIHLVDCNYNFRLPDTKIYIPNLDEINLFDKFIKNINHQCIYYLHILIPPFECKIYNFSFTIDKEEINKLSINNVFVHYLTIDENVETSNEQCRHWSWSNVFDIIDNIDS